MIESTTSSSGEPGEANQRDRARGGHAREETHVVVRERFGSTVCVRYGDEIELIGAASDNVERARAEDWCRESEKYGAGGDSDHGHRDRCAVASS